MKNFALIFSTIILSACVSNNEPKRVHIESVSMARMNAPVAKVVVLHEEAEFEFLPEVKVVALHDEAEFEFIPAAE